MTSLIAVESINSQQNDTTLSIQNITIQPNGLKSAKISILNIENLGAFNSTISYDLTVLNVADIETCDIETIFFYQNTTK